MSITYDHSRRIRKLQTRLRRENVDGLLVNHRPNVRYLSGFHGEDSLLLVDRDGAVLISDERFREEIETACPDMDTAIRGPGRTTIDLAADVIARRKLHMVAVEAASITLSQWQTLLAQLSATRVVPSAGWVESLREIKDRQEIAAIRRSIRIAERAFQMVRACLLPHQTEQQVAWAIEQHIRQLGGEGCSFPPIVAKGPHAALPHARPRDEMIGDSPFLLIDWGATYDEYCSDLTRMLANTRIPPKFERIYKVVSQAQLAAIRRIRPGESMSEIDRAARSVIERAKLGKRFGHALGHGIGLEIHEAPRLAAGQDRPLKVGMVVTVEPGIYIPGWGGIRIEDDVLVTRDGFEILTSVPSDVATTITQYTL